MRAVDIIIKKRDGHELTKEEIYFFIEGYTRGEIPDYQVSAWAMAVLLNGMTARETTDLTLAIVDSGQTIDLTGVVPVAVDKHSTGGVGDKTTLVVEPTVAACGLAVGKMSGRGLGFSGGTLDKMESIPGYRADLSHEEFLAQLRRIGLVLTGQTSDLAPADGKLYALRDVTGTVQSIPLIASSVMSKKIAGGAQAILLDVKVGLGAFMETLDEARRLAELMVSIGRLTGRRVVALLSNMDQPLGYAVGNALELKEAIETLHGSGPADFTEHCLEVASQMLVLGQKTTDLVSARRMAELALAEGRAWEHFRQLVIAQGGDVRTIDEPGLLPAAKYAQKVEAAHDGWISQVNARQVGEVAVSLGAGRAQKGDQIKYGVGVTVHVKVGHYIRAGKPIFTIHADNPIEMALAHEALTQAIAYSGVRVDPLPLFHGVIGG
jgi:pyrimidine-nucleoside phosphorylase